MKYQTFVAVEHLNISKLWKLWKLLKINLNAYPFTNPYTQTCSNWSLSNTVGIGYMYPKQTSNIWSLWPSLPWLGFQAWATMFSSHAPNIRYTNTWLHTSNECSEINVRLIIKQCAWMTVIMANNVAGMRFSNMWSNNSYLFPT